MLNLTIHENLEHYRQRPNRLNGFHRFTNGQIDVFADETAVLDKIAWWSKQAGALEIAGRLVGRPFRDNHGHWVAITGAMLSDFTSSATAVRTNPDDAARTAEALEQLHPTEELAGWFHSHPSGLDRYSSVDKVNQAEWHKPYHVGFLGSVHKNLVKVHAYCGPQSERLTTPYIWCPVRNSAQSSSALIALTSSTRRQSFADTPGAGGESWISKVLRQASWPAAFVIATSYLVDTLSREWPPVVTRLRQTEHSVERLRFEMQQQSQQMQQQLSQMHDDSPRLDSWAERVLNGLGARLSTHKPTATGNLEKNDAARGDTLHSESNSE